MEVGLGPGHIVLDGEPTPLLKGGAEPPPQFSAHFYCGQTVGCIKMLLGMDVGLSPGYFVLDGDPAGCIRILLGTEVCLGLGDFVLDGNRAPPQKGGGAPRRHCVRWDPALPPKKGHSPPNFRPMFIVIKRMVGMSASVNLPCTIKSRSSLLAPAHPCGLGKRAVKPLWCGGGLLWPNGWIDQDATW